MPDILRILTLCRAGIHAAFLKTEDDSTGIFGLPSENNHEDSHCRYLQRCQRYIKDSFRAAQAFSPEYIPFATPFITCSLIGPNSINLAFNRVASSNNMVNGKSSDINAVSLRLCLQQFDRYWNIASLLLGKITMYSPFLLMVTDGAFY